MAAQIFSNKYAHLRNVRQHFWGLGDNRHVDVAKGIAFRLDAAPRFAQQFTAVRPFKRRVGVREQLADITQCGRAQQRVGQRMQRDVASAALEQAKARLDARRVTLSYTRITSPIDGRVGHSSFHVGSLVNPASGVLVEVVQLDPIRIAFALEEGAFAAKAGQHADINAMKRAWQALIDSNGQRVSGELTSVDNRVDPRTASVMLRAEFANPRHQLLPGGNVNVFLRPASEQPVLTLPAAAVQQNGDGFFAWVVNADGNAEMRLLNVAGQIGQQFQIASGVKPGERAITDGAQRVQPGAAVQILN